MCKDSTQERKISSLTKFNTWLKREIQQLKQRETYKYLGTEESEGMQHLTNERVVEEGIQQQIKNDTEMWVQCQEYNYSNWSIGCSNINTVFVSLTGDEKK